MIRFQHAPRPALDAIAALYAASPLRRPIGDPARLKAMFDHANVVISAWDGERLAGLARGWTDHAFDGYICDLAVHPAYQGRSVGRRLLEEARTLGPGIQWVLSASPLARDYYAHLGWEPITTGWKLQREDPLPSYEDFRAEFAHLAEKA